MSVGETRIRIGGVVKRHGRPDIVTSTGRDLLVLGVDRPNENNNSGVLTGSGAPTLTDYGTVGGSDLLQYSTPNQLVTNVQHWGQVLIKATATNMVFKNCAFRGFPGPSSAGSYGAFVQGDSYNLRGAQFIDCSFIFTAPNQNPWNNALAGGNFTAKRCELAGGVDQIGLTMPNTVPPGVIEQCWIHNGYYESWAPGTPNKPTFASNDVHADGIQIHRGKGHIIRGNYIGGVRIPTDHVASDDSVTSCIFLTQTTGTGAADKIENVIIEKNWLEGGAAVMNIGYLYGNDFANCIIRDNWFIKQTWTPPTYYVFKPNGGGANPQFTNNRLIDKTTGADLGPVPVAIGA